MPATTQPDPILALHQVAKSSASSADDPDTNMPTTRSKSERHQQFLQAFPGPFRFLDLPVELRLFVYKAVFTHSILHLRRHPYKRQQAKLKPMVDHSDFPHALITTCRQIRHESRVLLAQMTRLFVEDGLHHKIPHLIGPEFRQHLGHLYLSPIVLSSDDHRALAGMDSLQTLTLWVESDHPACRSSQGGPLARVCQSRLGHFRRQFRDTSSLLHRHPELKVTLCMHFHANHLLRGLWAHAMISRCLVAVIDGRTPRKHKGSDLRRFVHCSHGTSLRKNCTDDAYEVTQKQIMSPIQKSAPSSH